MLDLPYSGTCWDKITRSKMMGYIYEEIIKVVNDVLDRTNGN